MTSWGSAPTLLEEGGANPNTASAEGETPLMIAERTIAAGSAPVLVRTTTGDLLKWEQNFVTPKVGDRALAEDIIQDAFIKVIDRPVQAPADAVQPVAVGGHQQDGEEDRQADRVPSLPSRSSRP